MNLIKKEKAIVITDKLVEYCLYGLIFFIPISIAAVEVFFSLGLLFFLIKKILKPEFKFLGNPQHFFLLLFIGFSALSLFNSGPYFIKSLKALFFKWMEYLLIFIIAEDTLFTYSRIRNSVFILLTVSGLVGIDGLFQRFSGIEFLRQRHPIITNNGLYAITASFQHYNSLGAYLAVILSSIVALLISKKLKKKLNILILAALGILLGTCLLLTLSRGSWLSFTTSLILMMILLRRFRILVIILCIFVLAFSLLPVTKERTAFTLQKSGDSSRFAIWRGDWLIIKDNPLLGKGLGTFMDYFPRYAPNLGVLYAHNCFLQIWAETGIFSLLSFLLFVGSFFYTGINTVLFSKGLKRGLFCNGPYLLVGLICGIFGYMVHSFFANHLYSLQLAVLFWFMLGLAVAITRLEPDASL